MMQEHLALVRLRLELADFHSSLQTGRCWRPEADAQAWRASSEGNRQEPAREALPHWLRRVTWNRKQLTPVLPLPEGLGGGGCWGGGEKANCCHWGAKTNIQEHNRPPSFLTRSNEMAQALTLQSFVFLVLKLLFLSELFQDGRTMELSAVIICTSAFKDVFHHHFHGLFNHSNFLFYVL